MKDAVERLLSLNVSDVMQSNVVTVAAHQTMNEAAALLARHEISGAPVVDIHGRCVGVLTATDFLRKEVAPAAARCGDGDRRLERSGDSGAYGIAPLAHDLVGDRMTTAVQSVRPQVSLLSAARIMCAGHVHRLLVIDEHNHPVGVITTLDVVAALVNAVEESAGQGRER